MLLFLEYEVEYRIGIPPRSREAEEGGNSCERPGPREFLNTAALPALLQSRQGAKFQSIGFPSSLADNTQLAFVSHKRGVQFRFSFGGGRISQGATHNRRVPLWNR